MQITVDLTERRIIEATVVQIANKGYETISLRKIANQVGLTTGAFYKRFDNKEALFSATTAILSQRLAEQMQAQVSSTSNPTDKLLKIAKLMLDKFQQDPNTMNFLFFNPAAQKFLVSSSKATDFSFYKFTMAIIDELRQTNRSLDQERLFLQIWSFLQGYGLLLTNHVANYDPELIESTLQSFLKV